MSKYSANKHRNTSHITSVLEPALLKVLRKVSSILTKYHIYQ